jgi:hypothetical protein
MGNSLTADFQTDFADLGVDTALSGVRMFGGVEKEDWR